MTLPTLIENAMRTRFRDDSLRYAYTLGAWSLEQSRDPGTLMMTLGTADGFKVCFLMSREQADALGRALDTPVALDAVSNVH